MRHKHSFSLEKCILLELMEHLDSEERLAIPILIENAVFFVLSNDKDREF